MSTNTISMERNALPRPIRVMQFAYGASMYGAERWILTLIKHLHAEAVETVVAGLQDGDQSSLPLLETAKALGFETLEIDARKNLIRSSVAGLKSAIADLSIDIVHSHGARQDLISCMSMRRSKCKWVTTPHGWEATGGWKLRLVDCLNKWSFPLFDAVAPLSQGLVDDIRFVPIRKHRLHLIPNGVDLNDVEAAVPLDGPLPTQRDDDELSIGFIGRLIPGKGCDVLIDALAELPQDGWNCTMIGDGPEYGRLREKIALKQLTERIGLVGFRQDRLSLLKRFDLFVLPSYREGTPRAMLEAMAAGVPCVGSNIPGIAAAIEHGVSGEMFPAGDTQALARLLKAYLQDRGRGDQLRQAAKSRVYEQFSASSMAASYEALFQKLVEGGQTVQPTDVPHVASR